VRWYSDGKKRIIYWKDVTTPSRLKYFKDLGLANQMAYLAEKDDAHRDIHVKEALKTLPLVWHTFDVTAGMDFNVALQWD